MIFFFSSLRLCRCSIRGLARELQMLLPWCGAFHVVRGIYRRCCLQPRRAETEALIINPHWRLRPICAESARRRSPTLDDARRRSTTLDDSLATHTRPAFTPCSSRTLARLPPVVARTRREINCLSLTAHPPPLTHSFTTVSTYAYSLLS